MRTKLIKRKDYLANRYVYSLVNKNNDTLVSARISAFVLENNLNADRIIENNLRLHLKNKKRYTKDKVFEKLYKELVDDR